jgi:hypothetical protein
MCAFRRQCKRKTRRLVLAAKEIVHRRTNRRSAVDQRRVTSLVGEGRVLSFSIAASYASATFRKSSPSPQKSIAMVGVADSEVLSRTRLGSASDDTRCATRCYAEK